MNNFKTGDVVQLVSGGSKMVVHSTDDKGNVLCHWHDNEGKSGSCYYLEPMLKAG